MMVNPADFSCPLPLADDATVVMGHGGGGQLSADLISSVFLPVFAGADETSPLAELGDGAVLAAPTGRIVIATDAHVVHPLEFPGGNIGELAIHGTVNDVAMMGARPVALAVSFVLEEGLSIALLRRIVAAMGAAAAACGVAVVTGDTKVVDRGKCDGMFITTTGIGHLADGVRIGPRNARPGDAVIVSAPIARHGVAIMSVRAGLEFASEIRSDTASVAGLVAALLTAGVRVHTLRDPTRGGLAATLNEISVAAGVGIEIADAAVPVPADVAAACGLLGLDPMQVANEGVFVAVVDPADRELALRVLHADPLGAEAVAIGSVVAEHPGKVVAATPIGAHRVVPLPLTEPLPRIC